MLVVIVRLLVCCGSLNDEMAKNISETNSKGNNVNLSTFLSWKNEGVIGYKTEELEGKKVVNFVWCKVCARYKEMILSRLKGSMKTSALAFIDGTNFVTKQCHSTFGWEAWFLPSNCPRIGMWKTERPASWYWVFCYRYGSIND